MAASELWSRICETARNMQKPSDEAARGFFEANFQPHYLSGTKRGLPGLITGYYEPLLQGSRKISARFRFPLYRKPTDLLTVNLGGLYPELKQKRLRGRLQGNQVVPYYSRAEIDAGDHSLVGQEILWTDDAAKLFFLHIQGSGRVQLPSGELIGVGYADQNGHPYVSIGKRLIEWGEIERENVDLFSILAWLRAHPDKAQRLYEENPSYVFFRETRLKNSGPTGSLQVPLTPERSLAVDKSVIPLGSVIWLDTRLPDNDATVYRRLMFAQDTGGAIKGLHRADIFWGSGDNAERMAGSMKQQGRLYVLLPIVASTGN